MSKIRRINLFSGPCSGKSLAAVNIRAQLGFKGYNIELIDEEIKEWTYIPRIPVSCDCLFLQARQIQKEDIRLRAGVELIVSDSPVFMQYYYGVHHNNPFQSAMLQVSLEFDEMYPALNIFVEREDKFYMTQGRYEDLSQAKEIDKEMKELMVKCGVSFKELSCLGPIHMVDWIARKLIGDV